MSELWVEKTAAPAALLLADGSVLRGTLYLAPFSPRHAGPQSPGELLDEPEPLLPFRLAAGTFALVGKAAVAAVRVGGPADSSDLLVRLPARLRLNGGHGLEGLVLGETGAGDRLSDLLNTPDPWVRLQEPQGLAWVAKRHLLTVEPSPA
ncbi:MAG: hypothetical protein AB1578_10305 [Thermodesulfobacteriota bacterium]